MAARTQLQTLKKIRNQSKSLLSRFSSRLKHRGLTEGFCSIGHYPRLAPAVLSRRHLAGKDTFNPPATQKKWLRLCQRFRRSAPCSSPHMDPPP